MEGKKKIPLEEIERPKGESLSYGNFMLLQLNWSGGVFSTQEMDVCPFESHVLRTNYS